jgi:8-oxo-dGTP diphosphatase
MHPEPTVVPAVGAVLRNADGHLLVVRRANPPGQGLWSLPGGRVRAGEALDAACAREVLEETGLHVLVDHEVGRVDLVADATTFEVVDFSCTVVGGRLRPGDDASDVRWVDEPTLRALQTSAGLVDTLTRWGVLASTR